jgi:hypothetical protein
MEICSASAVFPGTTDLNSIQADGVTFDGTQTIIESHLIPFVELVRKAVEDAKVQETAIGQIANDAASEAAKAQHEIGIIKPMLPKIVTHVEAAIILGSSQQLAAVNGVLGTAKNDIDKNLKKNETNVLRHVKDSVDANAAVSFHIELLNYKVAYNFASQENQIVVRLEGKNWKDKFTNGIDSFFFVTVPYTKGDDKGAVATAIADATRLRGMELQVGTNSNAYDGWESAVWNGVERTSGKTFAWNSEADWDNVPLADGSTGVAEGSQVVLQLGP